MIIIQFTTVQLVNHFFMTSMTRTNQTGRAKRNMPLYGSYQFILYIGQPSYSEDRYAGKKCVLIDVLVLLFSAKSIGCFISTLIWCHQRCRKKRYCCLETRFNCLGCYCEYQKLDVIDIQPTVWTTERSLLKGHCHVSFAMFRSN